MSDSLSFKEFFVNQDFISIDIFLINILLTTMMSFLLATLYIKFGSSLSDRKTLANVLITISLTTMILLPFLIKIAFKNYNIPKITLKMELIFIRKKIILHKVLNRL